MQELAAEERARLVRAGARLADAERRTWSFALLNVVALVLFALAPRIPRASHLFGAMTVPQGFVILTPGALATLACLQVHRTVGSDARAYRFAETIESFLLYASNVFVVFATKMTWPVLWILCPFTAVFWAITKPFDGRLYLGIIAAAHALGALAYVARGDSDRAWVALFMGAAMAALFATFARQGRRSVALEAERNVARAKLDEATLDQARRRIASALHDGIGREIAELGRDLERHAAASHVEIDALAEHARATRSGLDAIADASSGAACTLAELGARIDRACRPLCEGARYERAPTPDEARVIAADRARALLRVAQELVRNAVLHGRAGTVRVAFGVEADAVVLRVDDDGAGLCRARFDAATGGLANAAAWLGELEGRLDLLDADAGAPSTRLRARLPLA